MSHNNISIFIPHIGCPNMCSFCNQHTISGSNESPTAESVRKICEQALSQIKDKANTEIAFFGGSFTAINHNYMLELLECVQEYIGEKLFKGIRISTRPDAVNSEILELLKKYNVTSIELGAQSMKDHVLKANDRGHSADDVIIASNLIKDYNFELGLQMMVGLYKSTADDEIYTMNKIISLKPKTVRIYPVAVLNSTRLEKLYNNGEYELMPFNQVVRLCSVMMKEFVNNDIRIIRVGLHSSENVANEVVAGYYHPAFKELCESEIVRELIDLHYKKTNENILDIFVNKSAMSRTVGHKKSNKTYFENLGIKINFIENSELSKNEIRINKDVYNVFKIT